MDQFIAKTVARQVILEIGEGFLIGEERVVTKVSGRYRAPAGVRGGTVSMYRDCYLQRTSAVDGSEVRLDVPERWIAVVAWSDTH